MTNDARACAESTHKPAQSLNRRSLRLEAFRLVGIAAMWDLIE
jgi:hypothetical protein